ncbi:fimbria/pilus periplasmic chaperone (plasmid) [Serratia ureilytica]|uniref:fimbrial biogenesis chaperone n=1 Tax=Serratia ureilytica TaxID=300181 RepID=UPI001CC0846C|nr:fimbria/pilus periplasmic chaperone [Serratia ureilytica]UAN29734.1 fimbria/pilus periplasmic chaperone [Serratia ureilytica]
MSKFIASFFLSMIFFSGDVGAGVIIGATRVIFDADKKETSLTVNNPDNSAYLVQSWIEQQDGVSGKAPFIITPPLVRLDPEQKNVLRLVRAGGGFPEDKESLFWLNIKSIPSTKAKTGQNTLQIAIKTRIKLIYRPSSLKSKAPEEFADKLKWQRTADGIKVDNPTPYYMNFYTVKLDGKTLDNVTFVAPYASVTWKSNKVSGAKNIIWQLISDFGGVGATHTADL